MDAKSINVSLDETIKQSSALENTSQVLQEGVQSFYNRLGRPGKFIQNILNGTWLGHPLHPVLVDIPIGAWTVTVLLDLFEAATGRKKFGRAADTAAAIGAVAAVSAAAAGLTDWQHTNGQARRIGFVHASLNTAALALFGGSLVARRNKKRQLGRGLALIGFLISGVSAYLGGDMVFRQRVGVKHGVEKQKEEDFTRVAQGGGLGEGQMRRVEVNGVPVLLAQQNGQLFAMADTCSHLGCSLAEGILSEDLTVTCRCHGSRYDLATGRVIDGPSAYSQTHYDARLIEGQIEVRRRQ